MILEYQGKRPRIDPTAWIAPTAVVIGDVEIGAAASVWFGAVVRGDANPIVVGPRTNIQDNAVVHVNPRSRTVVGAEVTIGHAAVLEGCRVEDGALIGINAVLLDGCVVGRQSIIAAGSVVREGERIEPRTLAAGVPAEARRAVTEEDLAWVSEGNRKYVVMAGKYAETSVETMHLMILVPEGDRSSRAIPVDVSDRWLTGLLEMTARLFGGATAYGRGVGTWRKGERRNSPVHWDRITVVETWVRPERRGRRRRSDARIEALTRYLQHMCRSLRQDEIGTIRNGKFVSILRYVDRPLKKTPKPYWMSLEETFDKALEDAGFAMVRSSPDYDPGRIDIHDYIPREARTGGRRPPPRRRASR
jgi:carbonic anhydrase/acetyltransferase-like protein (isoleucine patch superfamily)